MTRKILLYAMMTEKCMSISERENKLVFRVDIESNKKQIKDAVAKQYKVNVVSVQTEITARGIKKAYVRLAKENKAADIVANMGVF